MLFLHAEDAPLWASIIVLAAAVTFAIGRQSVLARKLKQREETRS